MRTASIALIWCAAAVAAPPEISPIKSWVDRTAVYAGDRIQYTVRVEHSPQIEFVKDHVRKDQLSLDPFEVLNVTTETGGVPGGRRFFEVKLLLTTYDVGHSDVVVPSFNLFYFRRAQTAANDNAPAESLAVPPMKIGLRSTMADLPGVIRAEKPAIDLPKARWVFPTVLGWLCLIAALALAFTRGIALLKTGFWKRKMAQRSHKKTLRESFDEIRQSPVDSPESVEAFYSKASSILRGAVEIRVGACGGLTPREVQAELQRTGDPEEHATAVADLLEQCELARYAPDGAERARLQHPRFLQQFAHVIERS